MIKSNIFAEAQRKREAEQAEIKSKCGIKSIVQPLTNRKVRLDLTVPANTKAKLTSYAKKQGLSASVCVQILIDKAYDE